MLTNKSFIKWANENVVILISHNELGHDELEHEGVTGEGATSCPLYPGLRCRHHLDIAVETDNSRVAELPVIPFIELCPNSWLIRPDGEVVAIDEKAQFTGKGIRTATATTQKALGALVEVKAYAPLRALAHAALKSLDDEEWKPALEALAKLHAGIKKPGAGLKTWISVRMELVDEEVEFLFEDAVEDRDLSDSERRQVIQPLFQSVDIKVMDGYVPVRAALAKWLEKHPEATGK